ncbi:MAG: SPOR domain-containing protein, partial [Dorea sp.]|nr:SPOR domain-containing protein [Dorea sp.]
AERLLNELLEQGYPAFIDDSGQYLRVQAGEFDDMEDAVEMERALKQAGYPTVIVR